MYTGSSVTLTGRVVTAETLLYFVNTETHSYIIKQVQGLLLSSTPLHLISLDKEGMRWLYSFHEYPFKSFFQLTQSGLFASIQYTVRKGPFASVHPVYCVLAENKLYEMQSLKGF